MSETKEVNVKVVLSLKDYEEAKKYFTEAEIVAFLASTGEEALIHMIEICQTTKRVGESL